MAILQKGGQVPEFTLRDQHGEKISSKDIKGKILLSFHPLAFTSVCTDQMRDLENNYDRFLEKGVTPIGLSVDPYPAKGVWAQSIGLSKLSILADFHPKGALAEACGVYIDKAGISGRAALLIEDGKVLWSKEYGQGERPDVEEIIAQL
ncbi:MAG: redoxin domain-containing protein [Tissierellia bacterium]|nr:redoxin domain-containing protein [Tissierellia bacterium]